MKSCELSYECMTDKKYRYVCDVHGVRFKLYIPKKSVPVQPPNRIQVEIAEQLGAKELKQSGIQASLRIISDHSDTVRYAPEGNPEDWEIGEPYIPSTLLANPRPSRLMIRVTWK